MRENHETRNNPGGAGRCLSGRPGIRLCDALCRARFYVHASTLNAEALAFHQLNRVVASCTYSDGCVYTTRLTIELPPAVIDGEGVSAQDLEPQR